MRLSDPFLGAVLLLFAIAVGLYSQSFPDIPGQRYGAAAFPTAIAVILGVCGLLLLARGMASGTGVRVERTAWTRRPGAVLAVLVTVICVLAYILLLGRVGFVPLTLTVLVLLFSMLKVPWWQTGLFALGTTLIIDHVFRSVLLVPLPLGIMPRLPW